MYEKIKEQIKVVVEARQRFYNAHFAKDTAYLKWQRENEGLIKAVEIEDSCLKDEEAKLRQLTLDAYFATAEKAPVPGVGIRVMQKLEYDPQVAFDWAKAHKMALALDKKAFEKIAKADKPDFVTIIDEPIATIATELEVVG